MAKFAECGAASLWTLINRFFVAIDERNYKEAAGLFAPDGIWHRQGKTLRGPNEILGALEGRPAHLLTRHLITNFVPIVFRADEAETKAVYHRFCR